MKTYEQFIAEATAVAKRKNPTAKQKAEFARKFHKVADSTNFSSWKLTGHNPNVKHGTSKAVEAMKEKVFGKRRKGTSDLLFLHHKHGIITHPAVGDVTHSDVTAHDAPGLGIRSTQRKGIKVNKKIQAKVKEGGIGAIVGQGRVEHHEGGGGVISYSHEGITPKSAAVRTIARAYPKYKIHDGHGNLLESLYTKETKDGWQHSRSLGRRRWMKGSHSIERQGKRGWTVYDWHNNKELHVAKTAKEAKAWSNANRKDSTTHATIHVKPWTG